MKKILGVTTAALLLFGIGGSRAFAQNTSLQDVAVNVDGNVIDAASDSTFATDAASLGVNLAGYNEVTGLGQITLTTTTTGFFDVGFSLPVSTPFFNEYGATTGSISSGETWEIDDEENGSNNFAANFGGNALNNTNALPTGSDNYLSACDGQTGCNGSPLLGLGQSFVVDAGDVETVNVYVSQSGCTTGGICLEESQANDISDGGSNSTPQTVYLTLNASEAPVCTVNCVVPPPPATPEPSSWILMLTGMGGVITKVRSKFAA